MNSFFPQFKFLVCVWTLFLIFGICDSSLYADQTISGSIVTDYLGEAGTYLGVRPEAISIFADDDSFSLDVSDVEDGALITKKYNGNIYELVPFEYGFYFCAYKDLWRKRIPLRNTEFRYSVSVAENQAENTAEYDIPGDFIRSDVGELKDGYGNLFKFAGVICRISDLSSSGDQTKPSGNTADTFAEIKKLGFTGVKFVLGYRFFVNNDREPYNYNEESFQWLDQNIAWAKQNGLKVIINTHLTQGGTHYLGECRDFWSDPENQDYWIALWEKIAERYSDEPAVLGYSLLNEPHLDNRESIAQIHWMNSDLMQRCTDAIRTVDKNHVIILDRALGILDSSVSGDYYGCNWQYALVKDDDLMIEWHDYKPTEFCNSKEYDSSLTPDSYPGTTKVYGLFSGIEETNLEWQIEAQKRIAQRALDQYHKDFPIFIGEFGRSEINKLDDFSGGDVVPFLKDKLEAIHKNGYNYCFYEWQAKQMGIINLFPQETFDVALERSYLADIFKEANEQIYQKKMISEYNLTP